MAAWWRWWSRWWTRPGVEAAAPTRAHRPCAAQLAHQGPSHTLRTMCGALRQGRCALRYCELHTPRRAPHTPRRALHTPRRAPHTPLLRTAHWPEGTAHSPEGAAHSVIADCTLVAGPAHSMVCDAHSMVCGAHTMICGAHSMICGAHSMICDAHSMVCDAHSMIGGAHCVRIDDRLAQGYVERWENGLDALYLTEVGSRALCGPLYRPADSCIARGGGGGGGRGEEEGEEEGEGRLREVTGPARRGAGRGWRRR